MTKQPVSVDLFYDGGWHPAPVYARDPVSIVWGRADEGGEPTPASATCTISDRSGDYNPRNPLSSLYGLIGRNTPVRMGVDLAVDDFARTVASGWGATADGQAWTVYGSPAADYSVSAGLGRHAHATKNVVRATYLDLMVQDAEQSSTVSIPAVATGASVVTGHLARFDPASGDRYWLRCEFDVAGVITVKIARVVGGVWTDLITVTPGLSYTGGQVWRIRSSVAGRRLAVRVWPDGTDEPDEWTATALDLSLTGPGRTGVASWAVAGNTNTGLEVRWDDYQATDRRFYGEVSSWRPGRTVDFDPATGRGDAWVQIEAAGILRRLTQGADVLASPLRRAIDDTAPTAYWPLEDLDGAQTAASAVDGIAPMTPFGYSRFEAPYTGESVPAAGLPRFGSGDGIPGAVRAVDLAQGGTLQAVLPYAQFAGWSISWVMRCPRDKGASIVPMEWTTDGTWAQWRFQVFPAGTISGSFGDPLTGINEGLTTSTAGIGLNLFDGLPHHIQVIAVDFGSPRQVDARVFIDGVEVAQYELLSGPPMAGTSGSITRVIVNPLEIQAGEAVAASMPTIGHIAVWNPYPVTIPDTLTVLATTGHQGESTAERFLRLCYEQGVPAYVLVGAGGQADMPKMGAQRVTTFAEQLAEIERSDGGIIVEPRDGLGLVLRAGTTLTGQQPTLTADWSGGQVARPFAPVLDDLGTFNDVTASSPTTGGFARAVLEAGRMSVQPPPDGIGRAVTRVDVTPADDARLADYAWWALHLGTVDEVRAERVTVDLVAAPELTATAAAVGVGDRVDVTGLPVQVAPGRLAMLARGGTEQIGSHTRTITVNATPYSPYGSSAVADGDPRVPADGSTLAADITASTLTISLASTAGNGPWVTGNTVSNPTDFPLELRIGEERVTATEITGSASPQTVTLSARGVDGWSRAWPAGTPVDVWTPAVAAL